MRPRLPSFGRSSRNLPRDAEPEQIEDEEESKLSVEETPDSVRLESNPLDATVQSPEFRRVTRIFRQLTKVKRRFGTPISIPLYVLVGHQSAGKSTVINMLLKFPATFAQDGTATRCPVMYYIEQSESLSDPIVVWVNGERLGSWKELYGRVETHMTMLHRQNRFSSEPLEIRVQSPDVSNFVVVDLPGMVKTQDDERHAVDAMIKEALLKPLETYSGDIPSEFTTGSYNAIPIIISTFGTARVNDTFARIDELIGVDRPNWRNENTTIVVFNKMDQKLNFREAKDWLDMLDEIMQECDPMRPIFTNLRPPNSAGEIPDVARLTIDNYQAYLKAGQSFEQQWMQRKVDEFCGFSGSGLEQGKLREYHQNNFGFVVLSREVTLTMKRIVEANIPRVRSALQRQLNAYQAQIQDLDTRIDNNEPRFYRDQHQAVLRDFLECVDTMLHKGKVDICEFSKISFQEEFEMLGERVQNFGHTTTGRDRRFNKFPEFVEGFVLTMEELKRLFHEEGYSNEFQDMDEELAGIAQFDRLYVSWKAMVSVMKPPELTRAQMRAMKAGHFESLKGDFTGHLRNVLDAKLELMKLACVYLCLILNHFFDHIADKVCAYLAETQYGATDRDRMFDEVLDDDMLEVKFLKAIRDDYKRVMGRVIDENLLSYFHDSRFSLVNPTLPAFFLALAKHLQGAVDNKNKKLQKFCRESDPTINEASAENLSLEPGSDDELLGDISDDGKEPDDATEPNLPPVVGEIADVADNILNFSMPFGGGRIPIVKAIVGGIAGLSRMASETKNKVANMYDPQWRTVDLFNACMSKTIVFDIHDNEHQVDACVGTHLQIEQFLLLQDVECRVERVMDVANGKDPGRFLETALSKGLQEIDVNGAVERLLNDDIYNGRMMIIDRRAMRQELGVVLQKYFAASGKRIQLMSDEEVLERYSDQDQAALKVQRAALMEEYDAFQAEQAKIIEGLRGVQRGQQYEYEEERATQSTQPGMM